MADVLIFGCGLIGTSIGLALSQTDRQVLLHDTDPAHLAAAVARGAGQPWQEGSAAASTSQAAELVVVAVPPASTGAVLQEAQRLRLGATYTHVASVQSLVQADVERLNCDLSLIAGGHPLAGREHPGPQAADASMFAGRPWAVCPSPSSSPGAVRAVHALAEACGATPLEVDIALHDRSVARLSHLPQVAASALAGLLTIGPDDGICFELSGQGLADSTRLAAGDPALWTQILAANAEHVAPSVRALAVELGQLATRLELLAEGHDGAQQDAVLAQLSDFLVRGRRGRALVPVKRGRADADFATVAVEVDDQPGRLAALLAAAGESGINVEDVHVDHVPGRPRGVIALLVGAASADALSTALQASGWRVLAAGTVV